MSASNRAGFSGYSLLHPPPVEMSVRPLKRVKVSFRDDKLVLPVPSSIGKVSDLLAEATLRFRAQRLLAKDDSFIQMRTLDGYVVNPSDNVEEVLEQGDHLVLVNRSTWIEDFKASCQPTYWFGLREYDNRAGFSRDVSVAYAASRSALCITLWKGDAALSMEVFDRDALTSYAKDGDLLVMSETGKQDDAKFEQNVLFVVKKGQVTAVRLQLKTFSDPQTRICEWPLTIGETDVTYGEMVELQKNWPAAPAKEYTLPSASRTGQLLSADTQRPARDLISDPNKSTGTSPLIFTQTSRVFPEKYVSSTTNQYFRVELSVTNNSEIDTSVACITAEYQSTDGSWVKASGLTRGYRQNDYTWTTPENATDPFRVEARAIQKFALALRLELPAQQTLSTRTSAVDMSLPVPCNIRFNFTDQDGKFASINVTCDRRGLSLPTLETMSAEKQGIQKYFFVDDFKNGERFGAYYVLSATENYVRIAADSYYHNVDATSLHSHTTKAIAAKESEWEIANYSYGSYMGTIHLLIDLESSYAYGCRVRLSTSDSSLDESFLLPKNLW